MATKPRLNMEQLAQLPKEDSLYELDEGELITMALRSGRHGIVEGRILRLLDRFVLENGLGQVLPSDTGFILSRAPDTIRAPDVAYLTPEKARRIPDEGFVPFAPDIAVEVVSPSDSYSSLLRKAQQYLGAGSKVVCLVDTKTRQVQVLEPGGASRLLTEDDALEFPTLLPGLTIPVRELFT